MANLLVELYAAAVAFTITGTSLANSTTGVGRQSTLVDNTANLYAEAIISIDIKLGTSPANNAAVYVYLLRSNNDGTAIIDDTAGATDAGLTIINAPLIGVLATGAAASTGQRLKLNIPVYDLAPKWGIAVVNSSGAALDATTASIVASWIGVKKNLNG
jgi:hypothetical protein